MKFKFFIWISVLSLIILVGVQYYFINETFHTKKQQFDNTYTSLAKLGLFEFSSSYFDFEEDSILTLLDDYAYFAINDEKLREEKPETDSLFDDIQEEFISQLNQAQIKRIFLEEYFQANGDTMHFETYIAIRNLKLLTINNDIEIYKDTLNTMPLYLESANLINSYTIERNYFRINYDFYISFSERAERISREMVLTKALSFSTLLIVFFVFFMTLRNLWIQKRLSEMKSDFINNMTHELKTPLSTISVASSTLSLGSSQLPHERILEISQTIKKQNKHLTRLIDKILDISIWEKDQVKIHKKEVNFTQFIEDILSDFQAAHPEIHLKISAKSESCEHMLIDEIHFGTVINNLLSNALKYGGNPPEIGIEYRCKESLLIQISDNGNGISKEEQKHVFEKFYRGKKAKKDAIRGLGLGLYYVKQIVEAHGGTIDLESSDKGSIFKIQIRNHEYTTRRG